MIQCDICRDWLHGECVRVIFLINLTDNWITSSFQVDELQAADIDKYHCPKCEPLCGPSVMQKETNWHRNDPHDPQATHKPLQMGTKLFIEELGRRFFSNSDEVVTRISGKQLTLPYLNQSGFNHPILVLDKEGLSMSLPPSNFDAHTICQAVGPNFVLDVIDVQKQATCKMTIDQFAKSFTDPQDDRVLNCLSFEISNTPLSDILTPPLVARKLCWVNNVWPSSNTLKSPKPQVKNPLLCLQSTVVEFAGRKILHHVKKGVLHRLSH